jgi:heat-inducible transcriptional repressor
MSDLEGLNFLTHPHTSGGRVPTDKGFRYFVNELMDVEPLKQTDKMKIKKQMDDVDLAGEEIFKETSKILGRLTKEISVVSQPYFSKGILEKVELIDISSSKLLVVVSIGSGLVRTLIFDIESQIKRDNLDKVCRQLNEKLAGLSLEEIRRTFMDRIGDLKTGETGIINVFIDSIDKIFQDENEGMTLYIGGTAEILAQPEFGDKESYKNIIELTDDKNVVFHVLDALPAEVKGISISIGEENKDDKLKNFSIVSRTYSVGDVNGKIAVIGPKRMDYSKMISVLNYTSEIISEKIL